jgi:hypothetical protein
LHEEFPSRLRQSARSHEHSPPVTKTRSAQLGLGIKPETRSPNPYPYSPNPSNPNPTTGCNLQYPKLVRVVWVCTPGTRTARKTRLSAQPSLSAQPTTQPQPYPSSCSQSLVQRRPHLSYRSAAPLAPSRPPCRLRATPVGACKLSPPNLFCRSTCKN